MTGRVGRSMAAAVVFLMTAVSVPARDRRQNQPGRFDFYVLALSWSPSFCEAASERGTPPQQQCGARPHSFVVHGLWPQYEKGFPEYCQRDAPFVKDAVISSMLDLMPARALVIHEWKTHGTCSGLGPGAYFETVRKARAVVKIPQEYLDVRNLLTVTHGEVEQAFIKANPGLTGKAMAVTCDTRRLREVRICLGKDFQFRNCPEIDRRACRREKLVMPPVRGG